MSLHAVPQELHPELTVNISREADHRIANSLATIAGLVRFRAAKVDKLVHPTIFLREIADRIDTVGKLHHLIAGSKSGSVQLSKFLQEICERLSSALSPGGVSFSLNCSSELIVPFTVALPLGLIIAELFSNSLKYAHPAGLPVIMTLSCERGRAGELTLIYEDDGVGFPENFELENDGNLGMQFIRSLSKQLRSEPNWHSDPLGVRFEITVPTLLASLDG